MTKKNKISLINIALNRHISHNYFIKEEFEAGLALQGWEIKSLRTGRITIRNSYVIMKNGEAFLFNASFIPITSISSHYVCNPTRTRKLLLSKYELNYLHNKINHDNYIIIVLSLYWKNAWCKAKIGVAKGKKQYDKRTDLKEREWQFNKLRIMKNTGR